MKNNELIETITNEIKRLKSEKRELTNQLKELVDIDPLSDECKNVMGELEACDKKIANAQADLDNYLFCDDSKKTSLEKRLNKKYNVETSNKENAVVVTSTESVAKKSSLADKAVIFLAALAALGCLHHGGKAIYNLVKADKAVVQNVDEEEKEDKEEDLPFETYGQFTDINDEKQLRERATWYFDTFESQYHSNLTEVEKENEINRLMNTIRYMNGSLKLDNSGNVAYNETDTYETAIDLCNMANESSYKDMRASYRAYAPLFVDGSKAQKIAISFDETSKKVTEAIIKNDPDAFYCASIEWGEKFAKAFINVSHNSEDAFLNVYNAEVPSEYYLYVIANSFYTDNILEYSLANKQNICVPFCIDYNTGDTVYEPLSTVINDYNEKAIDAVAVRAGEAESYNENNEPMPVQLFQLNKEYYNSKYQNEMGYSRNLNK